jgi:hypothetical protein
MVMSPWLELDAGDGLSDTNGEAEADFHDTHCSWSRLVHIGCVGCQGAISIRIINQTPATNAVKLRAFVPFMSSRDVSSSLASIVLSKHRPLTAQRCMS